MSAGALDGTGQPSTGQPNDSVGEDLEMTRAELQDELMELPLEERLEIAQTLWDSAVPQPEFELTDEQKALLEERRAAFLADPDSCDSWEVVKARILAKL